MENKTKTKMTKNNKIQPFFKRITTYTILCGIVGISIIGYNSLITQSLWLDSTPVLVLGMIGIFGTLYVKKNSCPNCHKMKTKEFLRYDKQLIKKPYTYHERVFKFKDESMPDKDTKKSVIREIKVITTFNKCSNCDYGLNNEWKEKPEEIALTKVNGPEFISFSHINLRDENGEISEIARNAVKDYRKKNNK